MSSISIIGSGNMALAVGTRAASHGNAVELISRDPAKAKALADQIGNGATTGTFGAKPSGDIVIIAIPYTHAAQAVATWGDALAGKTLVDISNPFNTDATAVATTTGNSAAQEIADAAPAGTPVVKAINSVFGHVLVRDKPLDAFIAGDDPEAKTRVATFLTSMNMRPFDAGGLEMAPALEWAGILLMGLARNGAGFDLALGADHQ